MAKLHNRLSRGFLEKDDTPTNRFLLTEIKGLENYLKEYGRTHTANEVLEYRTEQMEAIQRAHWRKTQRLADDIRSRIEKHRQAFLRDYMKDANKNLLEMRRYENRYSVMDDRGLESEMSEYLEATDPADMLAYSPDRLEVLSVELKKRGKQANVDTLQQRMKERHYSEPWRYTPEGSELYKQLEAVDVPYGAFKAGEMQHDVESVLVDK